MVNTISFQFELTRFQKVFSVCAAYFKLLRSWPAIDVMSFFMPLFPDKLGRMFISVIWLVLVLRVFLREQDFSFTRFIVTSIQGRNGRRLILLIESIRLLFYGLD